MDVDRSSDDVLRELTRRYGAVAPAALLKVLCPVLIPIRELDKTITRLEGQSHYRASFSIKIDDAWRELMQRGRTGKFVPQTYHSGGVWREIAKGRLIEIDWGAGVAQGEVYTGGSRALLESAVEELSVDDFLEIDQYGAAAKVLSGLVEYSLAEVARRQGYQVRRMPEDMARHLGTYHHYDFEFLKGEELRRIEVKSLWGTDTRFARLIHSKSRDYPTSSCKFLTQDIFAVSLFLRTGGLDDFAFARSVPRDEKPYGLPRAAKYPEHVNQNPLCQVGDGSWFASVSEVWDLD